MKLAILIPAFNEEKTLARVIKTLPKKFKGIQKFEVIVINDGSIDNTEKVAGKLPVTLMSHWLNRGLGGALGTGFAYAKKHDFDCLITFDADCQHHPADIQTVINPIIRKQADMVVGSRLREKMGNMPWYRQIGIWGMNLITYFLFWVWTTDSQSGLRAFSRNAIQKIEIKSQKMEVSSEFFHEVQHNNLILKEVPIRSIYTDYSLSKGQKNINAFLILGRLIYRRFFGK